MSPGGRVWSPTRAAPRLTGWPAIAAVCVLCLAGRPAAAAALGHRDPAPRTTASRSQRRVTPRIRRMNPDNVSRHPPPPPSVTRQPHGAGPSLPHPLAPPVGPPPPWASFTVASAAAAFGALAAALGPVLRCIVPSVGATAPASISLAGNHGIKRPNPMRDTKVLFNLSGNALGKVGGSGMPKLCRAIQRNLPEGTALSILSLPEEGARPLSEALRENETITTLDLSGNALGMGDRGCVLFWDCLVVNKTLRILILINNAIGGQGAEFLAEGLRQNAAVHSVFLYRNAIGDRGAVALAEALKVNTTITNLYLQWNGITDAGAAALAAAMKVNATVQVLDLSNNDVANVRILQSIRESCQRNREGRPLPELPPDRYPRRGVHSPPTEEWVGRTDR